MKMPKLEQREMGWGWGSSLRGLKERELRLGRHTGTAGCTQNASLDDSVDCNTTHNGSEETAAG